MNNSQLYALTDEYVASGMSWHRARAQAYRDLTELTKSQPKVEDTAGQTMHSVEANKLSPEGRFANLPDSKPKVTGTAGAQIPRLPSSSPWSESVMLAGSDDLTTGQSIEDQPVTGEPHELRASVAPPQRFKRRAD
jgi:hypothetical protein